VLIEPLVTNLCAVIRRSFLLDAAVVQGLHLLHCHQTAFDHLIEDRKKRLDFLLALRDFDDDLQIHGKAQNFEACMQLDLPKRIGPRKTVAPARCISRALRMIASSSG